ncbi:AsmA family protein [Kordiimonas sp. SCSIO 12610]|uniref:DUF748 domain-containing protein n=1 Tax=Kordiimonas sp. SCSIO 12610 TaxID=2829597 RepID=UPI00210A4EFC|nr:AsmA family protein [Kordiimonas sp. SCSIO 12610]UTW54861.1 AsmA family protein [Kordiimonas sp. SCSIO 12610]
MKRILIGLLVVVLVIAGLGYFQLNNIVKTGVNEYGPEVLKVDVQLNGVNLSPLSGDVAFNGFTIGQPSGYGDGPLASLGAFDMKLETNTLLSDHIIIDSILIDAPALDVRIKDGESNFEALQKGMELAASDEAATESGEITLTIRKLEIRTPQVSLQNDGLLKVDETINLASFTLTNLGTDEKGLSPSEIARHVMDTLQPQIAKALVEIGAGKTLKNLADGAKDKLGKGVEGVLNKLDETTGGSSDSLKEKAGGLLGKLTKKKKSDDEDNN